MFPRFVRNLRVPIISLSAVGICAASTLQYNNDIKADYALKLAFDSARKEIETGYKNTRKNREILREKRTSINENDISIMLMDTGFKDDELISHLSGIIAAKLKNNESRELMTLFDQDNNQTGRERTQRYKFLFECLDLNKDGIINPDNFISIMTDFLEARFSMIGNKDIVIHDSIKFKLNIPKYVSASEYKTIIKYKVFELVTNIFTMFARKNDALTFNDFVFWCEHNDTSFLLLEYLFSEALLALGLEK